LDSANKTTPKWSQVFLVYYNIAQAFLIFFPDTYTVRIAQLPILYLIARTTPLVGTPMFAHSSQCEAGPPPNFHDSKTLSSSNWSATSQKTKNRGCPIDPWYFMEMMKITNWFKSRASSIRSRRSSVGASTVPPEPTPVLDVQVPIPFPEEKIQRYCKGGYHPTILGDLFQKRYKVVRKLGYGPNSTVWLALDEK
jgi:hypothetical protein